MKGENRHRRVWLRSMSKNLNNHTSGNNSVNNQEGEAGAVRAQGGGDTDLPSASAGRAPQHLLLHLFEFYYLFLVFDEGLNLPSPQDLGWGLGEGIGGQSSPDQAMGLEQEYFDNK